LFIEVCSLKAGNSEKLYKEDNSGGVKGLRRTEIIDARGWASDSSNGTGVGLNCFNGDINYLNISKNYTV
jgi:hypothetical protein